MSTRVSVPELKRMSADELRKEVYLRRVECAKMSIGIKAQSEKNHALYRQKRLEIARMLTVLNQLPKGTATLAPARKAPLSASKTAETPVKDVSPALKNKKKKS
jgi:ribosomal protein L29